MTSNVISLSDITGDATSWSLEQMLVHQLEKVRAGDFGYKKGFLILLDEDGCNYKTGYANAGMRSSQVLALLEVVKTDLLRDMGYLNEID